MALTLARILVVSVGVWVAIGLLFAIAFVSVGVARVDPRARAGTVGFRILILPAVVAVWPLLLLRWMRGGGPAEERSAHRLAAREPRP